MSAAGRTVDFLLVQKEHHVDRTVRGVSIEINKICDGGLQTRYGGRKSRGKAPVGVQGRTQNVSLKEGAT